ncbi:hypothetical protein AB0A96_36220, partial [Streptomyces asiaticus]
MAWLGRFAGPLVLTTFIGVAGLSGYLLGTGQDTGWPADDTRATGDESRAPPNALRACPQSPDGLKSARPAIE